MDFSLTEAEQLENYNPDELDAETFKTRYAGVYQKDTGKRLSRASMRGIWQRFLKYERNDFFKAHTNLSLYDIARVGIDKFVITMGWRKKTDVARWRNNKVRVGVCCHCQDQFILMILQHNNGMCRNCRPLYSAPAIRNFVLKQMHTDRYEHAHRDLFMDFYIMFYCDPNMRALFLKGTDSAKELEALEIEPPEWFGAESQQPISLSLVEGSDTYGADSSMVQSIDQPPHDHSAGSSEGSLGEVRAQGGNS